MTLAICDSAGQRAVVHPTVHLAHALHVQGIPLVVASQLPLTVRGSVRLVKSLHQRLFAGWHPTWALHSARMELFHHRQESHDWASLVAYVRLPRSFDEQLADTRFHRIRQAFWGRQPPRGGGSPERAGPRERLSCRPPRPRPHAALARRRDRLPQQPPDPAGRGPGRRGPPCCGASRSSP